MTATISKEERYAMIRRAAKKVQKGRNLKNSSKKLTEEVIRIDRQDHKERISWSDAGEYAKAHYGDIYNANVKEEWN
jgi:hypothetical protein|tara:strand:+ start:3061 stop:3291 length:231 start_codon:yes stop_codon:yes gene_type:complete